MDDATLYDKLAEHLDRNVVIGAPKSLALIEILKILFPREEAEIALHLPMQDKTVEELRELLPREMEDLEEKLQRMVTRGTVYTSRKPGKDRKYRLLPSVVGWAETPFWPGKETEETRKLAPLWLKYREEAFGREVARGGVPVVRVVPISKRLRDSSEVLPYEALKPLVEAQSFVAVANCPCRQMKRAVGEGCDHTLENCLHFGSFGRYMVEQGLGREITTEETLKILREANEEGLVHAADNINGHLSTICNCCGDCCVFLDTKKKMGLHTISQSNYVARVDADLCAACGTCEERCPVGAVTLNGGDAAQVDEDLCIGCGVCTPTCPTEAVDLARRVEIKPPPDVGEFLAARFKAG